MPDSRLQRLAHTAGIAAGLVAVAAFVLGYSQFRDTQRAERESLSLQREARAVDLFVKYNELMRDAPRSRTNNANDAFWRGNLAMALSESIFRLTEDDSGWRETVKWMVSDHTADLPLNCATYDTAFVTLVRGVADSISVCGNNVVQASGRRP